MTNEEYNQATLLERIIYDKTGYHSEANVDFVEVGEEYKNRVLKGMLNLDFKKIFHDEYNAYAEIHHGKKGGGADKEDMPCMNEEKFEEVVKGIIQNYLDDIERPDYIAEYKVIATKEQLQSVGIDYDLTGLIGKAKFNPQGGYLYLEIEYEKNGRNFNYDWSIPRNYVKKVKSFVK